VEWRWLAARPFKVAHYVVDWVTGRGPYVWRYYPTFPRQNVMELRGRFYWNYDEVAKVINQVAGKGLAEVKSLLLDSDRCTHYLEVRDLDAWHLLFGLHIQPARRGWGYKLVLPRAMIRGGHPVAEAEMIAAGDLASI
jgi:hypothetical protein